ncbi:hypothetical protein AWENTII_000016 [Aspergillus wentii]
MSSRQIQDTPLYSTEDLGMQLEMNEKDPSTQKIQYRYLELDTPLPTPSITSPPAPGQLSAPKAPNLKEYTSPFSLAKLAQDPDDLDLLLLDRDRWIFSGRDQSSISRADQEMGDQ